MIASAERDSSAEDRSGDVAAIGARQGELHGLREGQLGTFGVTTGEGILAQSVQKSVRDAVVLGPVTVVQADALRA